MLAEAVAEFDGPRAEIEGDLAAIVGRLEAEGLLLRVPGEDPVPT